MQDNMENSPYIQKHRALYREKNEHLEKLYEKVDPFVFYRELFPVGSFERKGHLEDGKANGIAITITEKKKAADGAENASEQLGNGIGLEIKEKGEAHRRVLTDELEELGELVGKEFAIMSPVSYFGRTRAGKNARYLYAIAFDLDGVEMPQLRDTLHQMNKEIIPAATYVVNSGTGLHLYYFMERPIPMYPQNQKFLKELKYALTRRIWNRFTSKIKEPQVQGVLQGFRVVGSGTKLGVDYPVVAYRFGKPVSIDYLISFLPDSNGDFQHVTGLLQKSTMSLEEAKAKYPDWYDRRIVQGDKRGRWTVKRDLYDWWLHRIESEITVGHRFYGIMTLAIYAVKCRIDEDELRRDAYRLLEVFDGLSYEDSNRFTKDDVVKALEMYNESYVTFPRNDIAKYSGIPIPANKRNWRKQDAHIQYMNLQRAFKVSMGESTNGGRPTVQQTVLEWRKKHPDERKSACIQATGLSKNSVYKWWYTYDEYLQQMKSSPSFSDLLMGKTK